MSDPDRRPDVGEIRLITDKMPDILPMRHRSRGMHVSAIISDMCIRLGYFKNDSTISQAWAELGNAWEYALVERFHRHWPDRFVQIGELEDDGIHGTPDLLDTEEWIVNEIKAAWMSSKHDPDSEKFWRYWVQLKAYCRMARSKIGRLHVCHVNGDYSYSDGGGPVYRVWEQEFSKEELDENWEMLLRHGRGMDWDHE